MGRVKYSLYDYDLYKELYHKGSIRSNKMSIVFSKSIFDNHIKEGKYPLFYFDYPEGFDTEEFDQILRILYEKSDPLHIWNIVYPQYYIQVTFCDDGDIIIHITEREKYSRTLVKYLKCVKYEY